jgi:diacylglycerol O-acyltransferase
MSIVERSRMSSVDTAWLRMDRPGNMMTIVSVTATATPLPLADFRQLIEERFLCFSRFRQRPVLGTMGAYWVEDDEFDLDAHIEVAHLPRPRGPRELQALAARLASTALDERRPLWKVDFVRRYRGGSAWVMRIHHCYADGIAMIRVLLSMTEADSTASAALAGSGGRRRAAGRARIDLLPLINWAGELPRPVGGLLEGVLTGSARLFRAVLHHALYPEQTALKSLRAGGMAGELASVLALPDDPATPLRGALSGVKVVAWADPLPLADLRTVGKALNCTINDVLMSTIAGALGSYLRDIGRDTSDLTIRATVPVNLRPAGGPLELGNRFGLVFVDLPLGIRNPLQRVYAMHDTMAALKGSMQPPMVLGMLGLLGSLPAAVQSPAIELFSRKATAVVSNVPGPQSVLTIAGQRISQMLFWVPQSGSIGVGISVLTYAGQVHFGLIADRALVPDPQAVSARFEPEFEKLLLAVTVGALAVKEQVSSKAKSRRGRRRRKAD